MTAVSIRRNEATYTSTNGVLFEIEAFDLRELDARETHYERIRLDINSISAWTSSIHESEREEQLQHFLDAPPHDDDYSNSRETFIWTYAKPSQGDGDGDGHGDGDGDGDRDGDGDGGGDGDGDGDGDGGSVDEREMADVSHPILQSYVDVVMAGCLEMGGVEFASEFVRSTHGWDGEYRNDRDDETRWKRIVDVDSDTQQTIDDILRSHHIFQRHDTP